MIYDLLIKNGKVYLDGEMRKTNLYIKDGVIREICREPVYEAAKVIDAEGRYVFPGFIDPHVHLNDPGATKSEDFYTGTCGAAAGGVTTVLEHPLTFPLPDVLTAYDEKKKICKKKAVTNFGLFGACSPGNEEEMQKMIHSGAVAFKAFLTYSPEIPKLNDGEILEKMRFLADKDIVLVIHCENDDIVNYSTEHMKRAGRVSPEDYSDSRPEIAEIEAVSRMCLFAREAGCKISIAHCSLSGAVEIIEKEKRMGCNVTVETCPQYLVLNRGMMNEMGVLSICNPPLRKREETEALWRSVLAGKVDWVCSDHAPYTEEEKNQGEDDIFRTPAGLAGIETTYQILFSEGVVRRGMSIEQFVRLSSENAARRYGLYPRKGALAAGSDADIVIFDPAAEWVVDPGRLKQKLPFTPYAGMRIVGKVVTTIVNGIEVYDGKEIRAERGTGKYVSPGR
ncbi:allantoinase AllB [Bacilliculturomica massiliensis]|uniref:allantoinase AllB n=1 Tax=Bacilliculturomica massiliensis TaxID=1917867 RepID=UPI00103092AA|nr:allantoinase AllB [Bacilliculturomica massiliensis]